MVFYLFLEQEKRRAYQPLWHNFNLLVEGRTMQIWGPGHWKIRCPFSGEGHTITPFDIAEADPRWQWRYRHNYHQVYLNYQDDYLKANEQLDQENEEQNNDENIHDDELQEDENGIHYEDYNNDQNNDEEDLEESEDDIVEDRCDFYHGM